MHGEERCEKIHTSIHCCSTELLVYYNCLVHNLLIKIIDSEPNCFRVFKIFLLSAHSQSITMSPLRSTPLENFKLFRNIIKFIS